MKKEGEKDAIRSKQVYREEEKPAGYRRVEAGLWFARKKIHCSINWMGTSLQSPPI